MRSGYLITIVAFRDYVKDFRHNVVGIILVAAILTPLLVLFGLKNGIIFELIEALRSDPVARELRPLGQGEHAQSFFRELRAKPETGFLIEDTRFLAASLLVRNTQDRKLLPMDVSMVPTANGDPLWPSAPVWQGETVEVVLSRPLAERLKAGVSTELSGRVGRIVDQKHEAVRVGIRVVGVLSADMTSRMMMLTPLDFLLATEAYREGFAVPRLGVEGVNSRGGERTYASFRLYAKRLEGVETLREWLSKRGINSKTSLDKIQLIRTLDDALTKLFWLIATFSIAGYVLTVAAQSSLTVIRKTRDLGVLKLLGFSGRTLALFPLVQSVITSFVGSTISIVVYFATEELVNALVDRLNIAPGVTSYLPISYAVTAVLLTVGVCGIVAIIGGAHASRVEPAQGLRPV
jgi:putative ABC transport system permease protein